jgi:hypothetical protein
MAAIDAYWFVDEAAISVLEREGYIVSPGRCEHTHKISYPPITVGEQGVIIPQIIVLEASFEDYYTILQFGSSVFKLQQGVLSYLRPGVIVS